VGQSVLVVLLARAWTDMGLFFHAHVFADAVGTCIFHLHHIAVVLCLGTLVNQVVISRLAPPDPGLSLAPATVGMSMGGTIAPAALQCKDESEVMGEAYAPLYLAFAVALFALLVELKRRLATTPASSLTRRYMIGFTELASNFLALSAAATLNATTKANIAFNAKEYLAAVVGGGVQSPRLPDPVLCQALWALAAFLILPSFLAAIAPLLASRLSILNFAIRLCAFYSAFQILNAVPTAIAEAQHTTVTISSSDAPIAHKAALALGMAALLALTRSLMLSGQRASLEEVSKGAKDGLDREEIEQAREAFLEHTMGLSLGWSWHPFVKACFVAACEAVSSQGEAVETVGVVLYTVVATLLVYQLYSALCGGPHIENGQRGRRWLHCRRRCGRARRRSWRRGMILDGALSSARRSPSLFLCRVCCSIRHILLEEVSSIVHENADPMPSISWRARQKTQSTFAMSTTPSHLPAWSKPQRRRRPLSDGSS